MFSIENKVAVITGGSSGIGKAAAERFARAGAKVVIAARKDAAVFADSIGAVFVKTDVSDERQVEALLKAAADRFGAINILINSAGVFSGFVPLTKRSSADMIDTFAINTLGPFYGMKHVAQYMPRGSSIINVSSIAGQIGLADYADYAASKFALNGLTRGTAIELGPMGIRVNCICPATVNTPMLVEAGAGGEAEAALCRTTSTLGTIIEPEAVAALLHFLSADDCPTISGQELTLDAGISAGFSLGLHSAIMHSIGHH